MTVTPDQIEREVEACRANVESTLDALKDRMSANSAMEHVGQFMGVSDTNAPLQAASRQLRENPIAFGLIGLGAAWLMLGTLDSKESRGRMTDQEHDDHRETRDGLSAYVGQQPLQFGAAALVVGAVIAAAMPRTRTENQMMGRYRNDLLDEAKRTAEELRERAVSAADDAFTPTSDADDGFTSTSGAAAGGARDVANRFTS